MNNSGFGERLRRERELRGVSRDEISTATRIGARYLEALENEQWDVLPGGIFNRGFVRAVARFLGLDEDDLVADYDLAFSAQNPQIEAFVSPPAPQKPPRRRAGRLVLLTTFCVIALVGTGWLGWRWQYRTPRQGANGSKGALSTVSVSPHPERIASSSSDAGDSALTSPAIAAADSSSRPETPVLELKVEAGKETSVSVSADGSRVFEGSMIAGQSRTFTAQDAIDISAKDAGALLLELNGQTLAPLGPPGQPGNVTLTRSDLKSTRGGAD